MTSNEQRGELRRLREVRGLGLREMAAEIGISPATLHRAERGDTVSVEVAGKLGPYIVECLCCGQPVGENPASAEQRGLDAGTPLPSPHLMGVTEALVRLAEYGVPPDLQEVLVHGNINMGISPGALAAVLPAPAEQVVVSDNEFRLSAEAKLMRQKAISNARERNAAERRVAELEAALKPFADEAGAYDPDTGDGDDTCWATPAYFKIRDLRCARAVLTSKEDADG